MSFVSCDLDRIFPIIILKHFYESKKKKYERKSKL